jgi:hypothetical protein
MKNNKPKGKTPSLIGGTLGAPRKKLVERLFSCRRCDAHITKGTECYEIPQLGGSFRNYKPYCEGCIQSILEKTREDLNLLFAGLPQSD